MIPPIAPNKLHPGYTDHGWILGAVLGMYKSDKGYVPCPQWKHTPGSHVSLIAWITNVLPVKILPLAIDLILRGSRKSSYFQRGH